MSKQSDAVELARFAVRWAKTEGRGYCADARRGIAKANRRCDGNKSCKAAVRVAKSEIAAVCRR